ncbi:MAG: quinone oxidoreductase family protein [Trueperaceae bacterium]
MKAIRIHRHGETDVLQVDSLNTPKPEPGHVTIKIEAAGINFIDIYQRKGLYKVPLPYTLGLEGAGTVSQVGIGVEDVQVGDRVAYSGIPGSYAEYIHAPTEKIVPIPGGVDTATAAAAMLQGMTAHFLVNDTYTLKAGDTCLIHAVAGGVGLLLTQMAKAKGATVIGTTSSQEKAKLAKEAGADHVILYTETDFEEGVKQITNGKGLQVVYDSVGQTTFEKSLNVLALRGMMVLYGQSSGPVESFAPQVLNAKGSLFLTRPSLFHYVSTKEELNGRASEVFTLIQQNQLKVHVGATFSLDEAPEAQRQLESRSTAGKILLIP